MMDDDELKRIQRHLDRPVWQRDLLEIVTNWRVMVILISLAIMIANIVRIARAL